MCTFCIFFVIFFKMCKSFREKKCKFLCKLSFLQRTRAFANFLYCSCTAPFSQRRNNFIKWFLWKTYLNLPRTSSTKSPFYVAFLASTANSLWNFKLGNSGLWMWFSCFDIAIASKFSIAYTLYRPNKMKFRNSSWRGGRLLFWDFSTAFFFYEKPLYYSKSASL